MYRNIQLFNSINEQIITQLAQKNNILGETVIIQHHLTVEDIDSLMDFVEETSIFKDLIVEDKNITIQFVDDIKAEDLFEYINDREYEIQMYPLGYVLDCEKSVRWNQEEVQRLNKEFIQKYNLNERMKELLNKALKEISVKQMKQGLQEDISDDVLGYLFENARKKVNEIYDDTETFYNIEETFEWLVKTMLKAEKLKQE